MIAIRRPAFDSMTARQRHIIRRILERLELGEPSPHTAPDGTVWMVHDDPRFSLEDVALLSTLAANWSRISDYNPNGKTRQQIRTDITTFLRNQVKPPVTDADDPWTATWQANGAPGVVRVGQIPSGWTPANADA